MSGLNEVKTQEQRDNWGQIGAQLRFKNWGIHRSSLPPFHFPSLAFPGDQPFEANREVWGAQSPATKLMTLIFDLDLYRFPENIPAYQNEDELCGSKNSKVRVRTHTDATERITTKHSRGAKVKLIKCTRHRFHSATIVTWESLCTRQ